MLQNDVVCFALTLSVVSIGGCFPGEAPPQTGVVGAAGHAREAGSGRNRHAPPRFRGNASHPIRPRDSGSMVLLPVAGFDEHQSGPREGQRRAVVCAARGLPGLSQKPVCESCCT